MSQLSLENIKRDTEILNDERQIHVLLLMKDKSDIFETKHKELH